MGDTVHIFHSSIKNGFLTGYAQFCITALAHLQNIVVWRNRLMTDMKFANTKLHSLVIFRNILRDPVLSGFSRLLDILGKRDAALSVDAYADFVSALFEHTADFSAYVLELIKNDENIYLKKVLAGREISLYLKACIAHELSLLQEISRISGEEVKRYIPFEGFMPEWNTAEMDFDALYAEHMAQVKTMGFGKYARSCMFLFNGVEILPVKNHDKITLAELSGYENERGSVLQNTLALLDGKPAANVLLYGDSGTGKSSTVKAVVNGYSDRGLRLVEVRKKHLHLISNVIDMLAENPLKFIIFIDDISFNMEDEDFTELKAMLEGSVAARTSNIAIYATSNRRHLVHETFSDRQGDEVHINETIQHTVSLSERFGLTVAFLEPGRDAYLSIVEHIAEIRGLEMGKSELRRKAEEFAIAKGGRSPRVARQFAEKIACEMQ